MSENNCALCEGTGFTVRTNKAGVEMAVPCACRAERRNAALLERAQIPKKYAGCEFDNFAFLNEDDQVRSELSFIHSMVESYSRQFPGTCDPHGLLLWGTNGIGKTHLAVAASRTLLSRGFDGLFINYQELLRVIRAGYDQPFGNSYAEDVLRPIDEAEVLLVDDLGSNRVTNWVEDTITDLIARRYDYERATIVTTNYSPYTPSSGAGRLLADRIGERATSRLREMCRILPMPNLPDRRGRKP